MNKDICNIKELSNYLNISISEVRKLTRQKDIPYFRLGNRLMFDLKKINLWIDNLEKEEQKLMFF